MRKMGILEKKIYVGLLGNFKEYWFPESFNNVILESLFFTKLYS